MEFFLKIIFFIENVVKSKSHNFRIVQSNREVDKFKTFDLQQCGILRTKYFLRTVDFRRIITN